MDKIYTALEAIEALIDITVELAETYYPGGLLGAFATSILLLPIAAFVALV